MSVNDVDVDERAAFWAGLERLTLNGDDYDLRQVDDEIEAISRAYNAAKASVSSTPIPMILTCPSCSGRHIDEGEFATKPHHTHACQHCGMVWRPALVATVGVQFLPGFKNEEPSR